MAGPCLICPFLWEEEEEEEEESAFLSASQLSQQNNSTPTHAPMYVFKQESGHS